MGITASQALTLLMQHLHRMRSLFICASRLALYMARCMFRRILRRWYQAMSGAGKYLASHSLRCGLLMALLLICRLQNHLSGLQTYAKILR